jgi:hypothetical protein
VTDTFHPNFLRHNILPVPPIDTDGKWMPKGSGAGFCVPKQG